MVGAPPGEDPRETGERLVAVEKNDLGVYPAAIAFRLAPAPDDSSRAVVAWGGEVAGIRSADLVSEGPSSEERSEREAAIGFLEVELADRPRPVAELRKAADGAGLAWRTVERAKRDIGAKAAKGGFDEGWTWALPEPRTKTAIPGGGLWGGGRGGLRENPQGEGPPASSLDRRPPTSDIGGLRREIGSGTGILTPATIAENEAFAERFRREHQPLYGPNWSRVAERAP